MSNNIITKILIALILIASIWQLDVLVGKFRPLAVNVSKNVTDTPEVDTDTVLTYTAKGEVPPEEETFLEPERIVIEKVGIDLQIVSVPLVDGTWKVNSHVANYAMGTSLINEKTGNVGIYAHDRDDAFREIKKLAAGDQIIIYSGDSKILYEVSESRIVKPEAVDVFYPTQDPILTLVTCDGVYSEKRYIIISKLVNISKI